MFEDVNFTLTKCHSNRRLRRWRDELGAQVLARSGVNRHKWKKRTKVFALQWQVLKNENKWLLGSDSSGCRL